ncbi:hypothetical protein AYO49_03050 [Verrucomicrobiaceae bacterium SCGC AG-212-N21]|nr:hypothetical protein AYO49_03050 [Verrucomicrobiaceae bacterium SCGC AG-212-N21]
MKAAWLCQSLGVHERRFVSAFQRLGHEVGVHTWEQVLHGELLRQTKDAAARPDILIGGPLHLGAEHFAQLPDIPFVGVSYAYDILYEARRHEAAKMSVLAALQRCAGLVVDCEAVLGGAKTLLGGALPPSLLRPWGLDRTAPASVEHGKSVDAFFHDLAGSGATRVLVCTRNWTEMHGILGVIDAFVALAQRHSDVGLLLAGDGPLRSEIERRLAAAGLSRRAVLAGMLDQSEVTLCLQRADCFVGASLVDGTSISLLQALDAGVPIVVPDVGGNGEWAALTEGCLTFEAGSTEAFVAAIETALAQWPHRRFDRSALMGARGNWERNAQDIAQFCESLAGHAPTSSAGPRPVSSSHPNPS